MKTTTRIAYNSTVTNFSELRIAVFTWLRSVRQTEPRFNVLLIEITVAAVALFAVIRTQIELARYAFIVAVYVP